MKAQTRNLVLLYFTLAVILLGFGVLIPLEAFLVDQIRRQRAGPGRPGLPPCPLPADIFPHLGLYLRFRGTQTDPDGWRGGQCLVFVDVWALHPVVDVICRPGPGRGYLQRRLCQRPWPSLVTTPPKRIAVAAWG